MEQNEDLYSKALEEEKAALDSLETARLRAQEVQAKKGNKESGEVPGEELFPSTLSGDAGR